MALAQLHPAPTVLGEAHGVQAAGNDEPIPFNGEGDAGRIGLDRAQGTANASPRFKAVNWST
jgi:hypothetical protein